MFKDVLIDEVFIQKNFYLWYLPTLFCVFVVNFILEKNFHIKMIYKLAGMFILSSVSSIIPLNLLRLVAQFAFWFYIGFCFEEYRERIKDYISHCLRYAFISMFIFVCLYILYCSMPNPDGVDMFSAIKIVVKTFCTFAGCFGTYCISLYLSHTNLLKSKVFYVLRNNTFGMYLYSDPWNYIVLAVLTEILGNAVFVTCWGSAVMYFGRLFITGSVSLMISCFLKKIRYYMANLK